MLEQLVSMGTTALLELLKAGLAEAGKRGLELGPIGISEKDFAAVDNRIEQALETVKAVEDDAFKDGFATGRGLLLGHISGCPTCRKSALEMFALADEEKIDQAAERGKRIAFHVNLPPDLTLAVARAGADAMRQAREVADKASKKG